VVNDALLVILYEEVRVARRFDVVAPMPRDPRLYRVCEAVLREPTISYSKEQLARIGHMSCRTMTRLFRSELQMTYSEWIQLTLGIFAMMQLCNGQPVFQVAADLGYASPSAFTATFRRRFGFCPSEIRASQRMQANLIRQC
jgi:AraC-like DNA-binding protein